MTTATAAPAAADCTATGLEFEGGRLLLLKRFGFRWAFVATTAGVAVCLPFMGDLMGLIGECARPG